MRLPLHRGATELAWNDRLKILSPTPCRLFFAAIKEAKHLNFKVFLKASLLRRRLRPRSGHADPDLRRVEGLWLFRQTPPASEWIGEGSAAAHHPRHR
ncbi:hypothetical protein [Methylorubrum aminovorans]